MYQKPRIAIVIAIRIASKTQRKYSCEIRYPLLPCRYSTTRKMLRTRIMPLVMYRTMRYLCYRVRSASSIVVDFMSRPNRVQKTTPVTTKKPKTIICTNRLAMISFSPILYISRVLADYMPPPPAWREKATTSPVTKILVTHLIEMSDKCSAFTARIRRARIMQMEEAYRAGAIRIRMAWITKPPMLSGLQ